MPLISLGIDTSCDECSIGIMEENKILSNIIQTQSVHSQFGGVVPELASREHIKIIEKTLKEAIHIAGINMEEVDIISATYGPGLIGSLLVGYIFGKSLSYKYQKKFYPANHILSHLFSPFIEKDYVEREFLGLVVSGGHTQLYKVCDEKIDLLGDTLDDACGEVYDKVAKLIGIGYPGGEEIEKWGREGDPYSFKFPVPRIKGFNFSFSGLKTAVLYSYNRLGPLEKIKMIKDISASFNRVAIEFICEKLYEARRKTGIKKIAVSGGVSANNYLQKRVMEIFDTCYFPKKGLTFDNGVMVAFLAFLKREELEDIRKKELYFKKRVNPNADIFEEV